MFVTRTHYVRCEVRVEAEKQFVLCETRVETKEKVEHLESLIVNVEFRRVRDIKCKKCKNLRLRYFDDNQS
jgi:hypothetical protein